MFHSSHCALLTLRNQLTTAVYDKPLKNGKEADDIIKDVIRLNDELYVLLNSGFRKLSAH